MKRRTHSNLLLMFVALLLVSAVIGACGSANKESGQAGVTTGGVQTIGVTECYKCHADAKNPASFPTVFGDTPANVAAAIGWLNGPHGNNENFVGFLQIDQRPTNSGFPSYGYEGLGTDPNCTTVCHDPLGEGKTISKFFTETGVTVLGILDRPVIGCEACHGGGGNHFGVGPMPYARPDQDRCGQCHNASFPTNHLTYHPEGSTIVEDYKASPHARSVNSHVYASSNPADGVRAKCSRCHTDQGAKLYLPISSGTMTYGDLGTAIPSNMPNVKDLSAVQCRTCHDGHNPMELLGDKDGVPPVAWSEEFKTCTSCHQLLKATGTWNTGDLNDMVYHAPVSMAGVTVNTYGDWAEIIGDTHYDDPNTENIEGYIVNPKGTHSGAAKNLNNGVCRDCHNPHKADNTINRQWARSAHGGFILDIKEKAIAAGQNAYSAGVTTLDAAGWVEDDFKAVSSSCRRCHTSTAFRQFANTPAAYSAPGSTWFVAQGQQRELLYCWACHKDNIGGIRNPGAFNTGYTQALSDYSYSGASITFPDVAGSNVCVPCHAGRRNRTYIQNGSRSDSFRPHHLPTAATVFSEKSHIAYEYDLDNNGDFAEHYKNVPYFEHDKIGTASAPGTGTNGPCVACHMGGSGHLFSVVTKSAGAIVAITNQALCNVCHTSPYTISATKLEEEALAAQDANAILKAYVDNTIPNYLGTAITSAVTDTLDYGAFQNSQYLDEDPGSYAHNRIYLKRIIFDSIARLASGGTNTTTISVDATTYPKAAVWFGAPLSTTGTYTARRP